METRLDALAECLGHVREMVAYGLRRHADGKAVPIRAARRCQIGTLVRGDPLHAAVLVASQLEPDVDSRA